VARLAALICLLAAVSGCGGDDKEDAEQAVRDFATAVRERDADRLCDDILTDDFIGAFSGASGDEGRESCKREIKLLSGLKLKLVRIVRTKVDGDNASVTAVIDREGRPFRQVYKLQKEDGDWKIAGAGA
jgi:ketosteroid isomerase-like protein